MARFTAIIAQLESQEEFINQDIQKADERWQFMREVVQDIAANAGVNGEAWAGERAKRALAETDHWFN